MRKSFQTLCIVVSLAVALLALGASQAFASFTHIPSISFGSPGSEAGQMQLSGESALESEIAVNDTTHDVYVADTGNSRVDQFSSTGTFIRAWGWGVADGLPALETCTLVCQAGMGGGEPGELQIPTSIAVDNSGGPSEGDVYVGTGGFYAVSGILTVQKFTSDGALVSSWGTNGRIDGSTSVNPVGPTFTYELSGIAVDTAGNLLVYDQGSARPPSMFKFTQDGTPATGFVNDNSGRPSGIAVDGLENIYTVAGATSTIEKFSAAGSHIGNLSGNFNEPSGLAVDQSTNDLYIDSEGSSIFHYTASCDPSVGCAAADTFGSGQLSAAAGLAVDSSDSTVYAADAGNGRIDAFGAPPAIPPTIVSASATGVTSTAVTLHAQITPNLYDTHYHFEYVDDAAFQASGFTNASKVPTPDADLGSAETEQTAEAHVQALQPSTTYRFRVVADNGNGGVQTGTAGTFVTLPPGASFALPDGRAYELVTPTDKGNGSLPTRAQLRLGFGFGGVQAAASGDGLAYVTLTALPGAQAGGTVGYVLASRGAGGWSSRSLLPQQATATNFLGHPRIVGYSDDLSKAALENGGNEPGGLGQDSPPLVSGEPPNNINLFLRDNFSDSYQLMNVGASGTAVFEGASADFSRVVFARQSSLYEWAGGSVSLVDQLPTPPATRCGPEGPSCVASPENANLGTSTQDAATYLHAVSPDGSKVFFTTSSGFGSQHLYMRENGATTVEISASQKTNGAGPGGTDPNGPLRPLYWPASADGSMAFFTSCEQLTNDSTAASPGSGDCSSGEDLYQYDTASGALTDLTVDHNPGDLSGADVQGVLGSSADGSYVYFVANGVLANGASLGDCAGERHLGQTCNLYLSHNGTTTFIAMVDDNDYSDWNSSTSFGGGLVDTARVTPDGRRLAFDSIRSLTGYDNTVASSGQCGVGIDGAPLSGAQCPEVFLYDAASSRLTCASCNPTGERPSGPSYLNPAAAATSAFPFEYLPRDLSDDGNRLFFDSEDALVSGDVNGKQDVYEYENGAPHLISNGTSSGDSFFLDASPNGDDVFFATRSQLVGQDIDQQLDAYDARVGGGFPSPPVASVPCVGDACRPLPGVQPADPVLGSASSTGAGNLTPTSSTPAINVKRKPSTRAQRLARALKECRRKPKRRRMSCAAHARRLYGPAGVAGKATRRSGRGTK
jgi:sugar lactone lactonase YvrE